jgi:hypothetical protein
MGKLKFKEGEKVKFLLNGEMGTIKSIDPVITEYSKNYFIDFDNQSIHWVWASEKDLVGA